MGWPSSTTAATSWPANPALEALSGFDAADLARLDLAALLHADDRPAALAAFEELAGDRSGRLELPARLVRADGERAAGARRAGGPPAAGPGGPGRVVLVLADARPRAALEARLEEADRLASIGTLAAQVANEITNPLAYLIGNMSFAREALGPGAATPPEALTQARQALDEAHEGAARVARVVSDLSALAREGPDRREPVDVPAALRAALGLATGFLQAQGAAPGGAAAAAAGARRSGPARPGLPRSPRGDRPARSRRGGRRSSGSR